MNNFLVFSTDVRICAYRLYNVRLFRFLDFLDFFLSAGIWIRIWAMNSDGCRVKILLILTWMHANKIKRKYSIDKRIQWLCATTQKKEIQLELSECEMLTYFSNFADSANNSAINWIFGFHQIKFQPASAPKCDDIDTLFCQQFARFVIALFIFFYRISSAMLSLHPSINVTTATLCYSKTPTHGVGDRSNLGIW